MRQRAVTRSAAAVPQGKALECAAIDYEPAYGFYDDEGYSYLFPRLRKKELIFADGGKYDYYYDETTPYEANVGMKTNIDVYRNDKAILTTCLLPVYKDAMFALESMEDGNVTQTLDYVDFVYDPSDGSYTLPSDQGLVGLFATVDEETGEYVYFSNSIYANLSLVPSGPAGIGGVETAGKGAAVATEYYDL